MAHCLDELAAPLELKRAIRCEVNEVDGLILQHLMRVGVCRGGQSIRHCLRLDHLHDCKLPGVSRLLICVT